MQHLEKFVPLVIPASGHAAGRSGRYDFNAAAHFIVALNLISEVINYLEISRAYFRFNPVRELRNIRSILT